MFSRGASSEKFELELLIKVAPKDHAGSASDNVRNDDGFGFFFQRNWSPQTGNARRPGGQAYR